MIIPLLLVLFFVLLVLDAALLIRALRHDWQRTRRRRRWDADNARRVDTSGMDTGASDRVAVNTALWYDGRPETYRRLR